MRWAPVCRSNTIASVWRSGANWPPETASGDSANPLITRSRFARRSVRWSGQPSALHRRPSQATSEPRAATKRASVPTRRSPTPRAHSDSVVPDTRTNPLSTAAATVVRSRSTMIGGPVLPVRPRSATSSRSSSVARTAQTKSGSGPAYTFTALPSSTSQACGSVPTQPTATVPLAITRPPVSATIESKGPGMAGLIVRIRPVSRSTRWTPSELPSASRTPVASSNTGRAAPPARRTGRRDDPPPAWTTAATASTAAITMATTPTRRRGERGSGARGGPGAGGDSSSSITASESPSSAPQPGHSVSSYEARAPQTGQRAISRPPTPRSRAARCRASGPRHRGARLRGRRPWRRTASGPRTTSRRSRRPGPSSPPRSR